jgi:hypothetical protein
MDRAANEQFDTRQRTAVATQGKVVFGARWYRLFFRLFLTLSTKRFQNKTHTHTKDIDFDLSSLEDFACSKFF